MTAVSHDGATGGPFRAIKALQLTYLDPGLQRLPVRRPNRGVVDLSDGGHELGVLRLRMRQVTRVDIEELAAHKPHLADENRSKKWQGTAHRAR